MRTSYVIVIAQTIPIVFFALQDDPMAYVSSYYEKIS